MNSPQLYDHISLVKCVATSIDSKPTYVGRYISVSHYLNYILNLEIIVKLILIGEKYVLKSWSNSDVTRNNCRLQIHKTIVNKSYFSSTFLCSDCEWINAQSICFNEQPSSRNVSRKIKLITQTIWKEQ